MAGEYPPIEDAAQVAELLRHECADGASLYQGRACPRVQAPGGRTFKFFRDEIYEFIRSHPAEVAEDEITDARKT